MYLRVATQRNAGSSPLSHNCYWPVVQSLSSGRCASDCVKFVKVCHLSSCAFLGRKTGSVITRTVLQFSKFCMVQVGVRLTTTNSRTPTNISVHWTRCDAQDSGQSAGNSIEQALGDHSQLVPQVVPLAAQEDPVSDTSTEERVEPESIVPGAETVLPVPEEVRGRCLCS